MTAFEGNLNYFEIDSSYLRLIPVYFFLVSIIYKIEFGVLPEIAKAVDEMEWT